MRVWVLILKRKVRVGLTEDNFAWTIEWVEAAGREGGLWEDILEAWGWVCLAYWDYSNKTVLISYIKRRAEQW